MVNNHMIIFRVNKEQMEKIREDAISQGYLTPSAYLRDLALNRNLVYLEVKVNELSKDMKQLKEVLCNG